MQYELGASRKQISEIGKRVRQTKSTGNLTCTKSMHTNTACSKIKPFAPNRSKIPYCDKKGIPSQPHDNSNRRANPLPARWPGPPAGLQTQGGKRECPTRAATRRQDTIPD